MTRQDFSDQFDVLVSAYLSITPSNVTDPIQFDEYEKSVFLTLAQEQLLQEYYTGYNKYRDSYEKTEEIRKYLNTVTLTKKYDFDGTDQNVIKDDERFLTSGSTILTLPQELWFIVYETVLLKDECNTCINNKKVPVVPIAHDELDKVLENPYRGPSADRVLRLDINNYQIELISKFAIGTYIMRYIKKPAPIILIDLGDDIKINGVSTASECELNDAIHKDILERAVLLALQSKNIDQTK